MRRASSFGGECMVATVRSTATLAGDRILVETRSRVGTFETDAAGCEPDLADQRADEPACVQLEVIEATAL